MGGLWDLEVCLGGGREVGLVEVVDVGCEEEVGDVGGVVSGNDEVAGMCGEGDGVYEGEGSASWKSLRTHEQYYLQEWKTEKVE